MIMKNLTKLKKILSENKGSYLFREKIFKGKYLSIYQDVIEFTLHLNLLKFNQKLYHYLHQIKEIPKCATCEKEIPFKRFNDGYNTFCSIKCLTSNKDIIEKQKKNRSISNKKNLGVENVFQLNFVKEKSKQTNLDKRGVEYSTQSKTVKEQTAKTNEDRYGKKYIPQTNLIKDSVKLKYNVINVSQLNSTKETIKKNNLLKYNKEHVFQVKEFREKGKEVKKINFITNLKTKLKKYDVSLINYYTIDDLVLKCDKTNKTFTTTLPILNQRIRLKMEPCLICKPFHIKDSKELEVIAFLKENGITNIERSNKNILFDKKTNHYKQIDIHLPDYKVGIEYNGLYYHSLKHRTINYHQNKSLLANENGTLLIHLWGDDWEHKQDIIKSMILNKLGLTKNKIYGRKTIIKEVLDKDAKQFLNNNHLQGARKAKINLGLYYNDKLVSLMTFGKSSADRGNYEMYRFCNSLNTTVIGGASKLFNHFIKNYNYDGYLLSFANLDHSNGKLYENLGFKFDKLTTPGYHYVVNGLKISRQNYQHWKLVKQGFDKNKTEKQIMLDRGINRIYNSGNLKYIFKK